MAPWTLRPPAPSEPAPETDEDLQEAIAKAVAIACYESEIRVKRGETLDSMKVLTGHGRNFVLKIGQLFSETTGKEPMQFKQQFFADYQQEPAPGFDMEVRDRDSNEFTFHDTPPAS